MGVRRALIGEPPSPILLERVLKDAGLESGEVDMQETDDALAVTEVRG